MDDDPGGLMYFAQMGEQEAAADALAWFEEQWKRIGNEDDCSGVRKGAERICTGPEDEHQPPF